MAISFDVDFELVFRVEAFFEGEGASVCEAFAVAFAVVGPFFIIEAVVDAFRRVIGDEPG